MKRIFLLLVASCLLQVTALAQTKAEKEVAAAVETLRKAMLDADKKTLENIAASELTYGHSNGKTEDKAAFVAAVTNPDFDYVSIDISDISIKIVDKNLAWVRHNFNSKTTSKGTPGAINISLLMVWQKQKGQWKLVARQGFRIPS